MAIDETIYKELELLCFSNVDRLDITEIINKDGVYLYRITDNYKSYVLKYFIKEEFRREIKNYDILKELSIKTMDVLGCTKKSILLEDLDASKNLRLGIPEDLNDIEIARVLAKWYIKLHHKGLNFVRDNIDCFYRETDSITIENIRVIRDKSNTSGNEVWDLILDNFKLIREKIDYTEETLNYNDFYWTNLIVSKDKTEAFMFDYNFLGIGSRYNDIRNVCSSLSDEAGRVFIREYGGINQNEKIIDDVTGHLINLIFSYEKSPFPLWGQESLDGVNSGELKNAISRLLEIKQI